MLSFMQEIATDTRYIFHKLRKHISVKSRNDLYAFWLNPSRKNQPEYYQEGKERSMFLVGLVKKYVDTSASVLEIGCNVGRNLHFLQDAGYTNLYGVEMNGEALRKMKKAFPSLGKDATLYNAPIEKAILKYKPNQFDAVYTMAVFEHIHPESEWIFPRIARITKSTLIIIENERHFHWRSVPRNYKTIFEGFGMKQVACVRCTAVAELGPTYFARVFQKKGNIL